MGSQVHNWRTFDILLMIDCLLQAVGGLCGGEVVDSTTHPSVNLTLDQESIDICQRLSKNFLTDSARVLPNSGLIVGRCPRGLLGKLSMYQSQSSLSLLRIFEYILTT